MGFNGYIPGDYKAECDRCGFEFRNSQLVTEWTGLRVCRQCWDFEPLYPTGPADKISVPIPRPEQEVYIGDNDDSLETNINNIWLYTNGYTSEYTSNTIMTAFDAALWP